MCVTRPKKTGLIYKKNTYSYYGEYLPFYALYLDSASFNGQLMSFCTYDITSITIYIIYIIYIIERIKVIKL